MILSTALASSLGISKRALALTIGNGAKKQRLTSLAKKQKTPTRVAVVGSGPAGCYTTKYLLSHFKTDDAPAIAVDVFERLPMPFGLVRYGVAPDHPEVKNVEKDFAKILESKNVNYFGNVEVGVDVSVEELRKHYDAVVLAYGCQSDRQLEIPGSNLEGVLSTREFVAWYNGHPDFDYVGNVTKKLMLDAQGQHIEDSNFVIVGNGNVALDCARILAKDKVSLENTDIASRSLTLLKGPDDAEKSRQIHVVGRRGHCQAAFTIKELRELTRLETNGGYNMQVLETELDLGWNEASAQELDGQRGRPKRRIQDLLRSVAQDTVSQDRKHATQVSLRFLLNPVRMEPDREDNDRLGSVVFERCRLEGAPGSQVAVGVGEFHSIDAQMCLLSIGYRGLPLHGTEHWFDNKLGLFQHIDGRVESPLDSGIGGLYVSGWLKRGPNGIIGSNIADAKETVRSIIEDLAIDRKNGLSAGSDSQIPSFLSGKAVVSWDGAKKIDRVERSAKTKRTAEQPREKLVDSEAMIAIAND